MSGSTAKENRKRLAKAFGPEVADALAEMRELVQQVHNAQRVLARQMQEFERELAAVKEGRAVDKRQHGAKTDELGERVDALTARTKGMNDLVVSIANQAERLQRWIEARDHGGWSARLTAFVTGRPMLHEIVRSKQPTPADLEEFFAGPPAVDVSYVSRPPALYERTGDGPLERVK